jgi:hypothetical protein
MNHLYKESQPGESLFQEEVLAYIELRENRGDILAELSVNSSQFTFLPIFYIQNTEQIRMKLFYRNIRTLSLSF